MTDLLRRISRRSESTIREAGKHRRLVVTLYPGGVIGLRPEKTQREELLSLEAAWSLAVRQRVFREMAERKKAERKKKPKS